MPIESLTEDQRAVLAHRVQQVLAELWCDQHGIDAEIRIVRKGENRREI